LGRCQAIVDVSGAMFSAHGMKLSSHQQIIKATPKAGNKRINANKKSAEVS